SNNYLGGKQVIPGTTQTGNFVTVWLRADEGKYLLPISGPPAAPLTLVSDSCWAFTVPDNVVCNPRMKASSLVGHDALAVQALADLRYRLSVLEPFNSKGGSMAQPGHEPPQYTLTVRDVS